MKININELEKIIGSPLYTYININGHYDPAPIATIKYERPTLKNYINTSANEDSRVIKVYHRGSSKGDDIYIEDSETISLIAKGWIWNLLMEKAPHLIALYYL